jgi:hypothetical protein
MYNKLARNLNYSTEIPFIEICQKLVGMISLLYRLFLDAMTIGIFLYVYKIISERREYLFLKVIH